MTDFSPDDAERARAAVALSCLAWLRSGGPAATVAPEPFRHDPRAVRRLLGDGPPAVEGRQPPPPMPPPHPLWDRWLDG